MALEDGENGLPIEGDNQEPTRGDVRDLARAIKHKWPIDPATVEKLPERMAALLDSKDERIRVRAANTLLAMNSQNGESDSQDETYSTGVCIYIPDNGRAPQ